MLDNGTGGRLCAFVRLGLLGQGTVPCPKIFSLKMAIFDVNLAIFDVNLAIFSLKMAVFDVNLAIFDQIQRLFSGVF